MEDELLEQCYEYYFEMFPNKKDSENLEDECEHIELVNDDNNFYKVCIACGQCIDYSNIQIPEFNYLKNATIKRFYKKTNYLKLKLNKFSKDLKRSEIDHIIKEFIKLDNLYTLAGKKIKYDFILNYILTQMGKLNIVSQVKKFKVKLEKKRLKEFNTIMGIVK